MIKVQNPEEFTKLRTTYGVGQGNFAQYFSKEGNDIYFTQGVEKFQKATGRLPQSDTDMEVIKEYADKKKNPSLAAPTTPLDPQVEKARSDLYGLSAPNQFIGTLKTYLRMSAKPEDEKLGTSPTFEKAGLTGFASLADSLSARHNSIIRSGEDIAALLNSASGIYKDAFNMAALKYQDLAGRQKALLDAQATIDEEQRTIDNQVRLYRKKKEVDDEFAAAKPELRSVGNKLLEVSYDPVTKKYTTRVIASGSTGGGEGGDATINDYQAALNEIDSLPTLTEQDLAAAEQGGQSPLQGPQSLLGMTQQAKEIAKKNILGQAAEALKSGDYSSLLNLVKEKTQTFNIEVRPGGFWDVDAGRYLSKEKNIPSDDGEMISEEGLYIRNLSKLKG